jgi:hypothetical protein
MLSRRVIIASRFLRAPRTPQLRHFPLLAQQFRTYADTIVKVPQMAESISEGTLKQWSKQIGDYVEQDEEIATIETDKVKSAQVEAFRIPRKASNNSLYRLMSQSMLQRLASSKSFSPTKRIRLRLGRIWSVWSLVELQMVMQRQPLSLLQRISQRHPLLNHRRARDPNPN